MGQLSFFDSQQAPRWTVSDLTRYLSDLLESDHNIQDVWVNGEVSNISKPASGHLYFTIKDRSSSLRCVMWKSQAIRLRFLPKNGDAVEVHGKIGIYEAGGQYQLYADALRPAGEGALYQEFLRLQAMLEAEGLFDPESKQPIPDWPRHIGIVTSPTGAALQDMLNTLQRRYPLVKVVLAATAVQGNQAPPGIAAAINALNSWADIDTIIIARGGGSIEDLWAFNAEEVVRAIAASAIPIISGVGHETDFTLADFAADLRAPTPTAAAELATPDRTELQLGLQERADWLDQVLMGQVTERRWATNDLATRLRLYAPEKRIQNDVQRVDELGLRAQRALGYQLELTKAHLHSTDQRLEALNPLAVLKRGFALVNTADGQVINSLNQVRPGDELNIRVQDGTISARATKTQEQDA
jgi:exodeoxyribonuclease VII large subunit